MRELLEDRWQFEEWQAVSTPPIWEVSDQVQAYFEELGEIFGIKPAEVIQIVQEYRYEASRLFKRYRDRLSEEVRRTPLTDWWEQANAQDFTRNDVWRLSAELFNAEPFHLSRPQREQMLAALRERGPPRAGRGES
jgi:hypothetical protein